MGIVTNRKIRRITLMLLIVLPVTAFSQEAPRWLTQRGLVYPPGMYIVGVGEGRSRKEAEERAVAQISLFFKTTVNDSRSLLYNYNEALGKSVESTSLNQSTLISSEVEFFGVKFAESYTDTSRIVHALAYLDREEVLQVYDTRIQNNTLLLGGLLERYEHGPNPYAALQKLRQAKSIADITGGYADMATLVNSAAASRYASFPALAARLDRAIENSQKRLTVTVENNDERVRPIALKAAEFLRKEGFLITQTNGEYTLALMVELNEGTTKNYHTVQPLLDITFGLKNGEPLARYQKEYAVFRHLSAEEALGRALRNIEQDISGNFSAQIIRRIVE